MMNNTVCEFFKNFHGIFLGNFEREIKVGRGLSLEEEDNWLRLHTQNLWI